MKWLGDSIERLALLLLLAGLIPQQPAAAQADIASVIIGMVNDLRASRGLAAYTVDAGLMAVAQEHSEYMAATHTTTHLHSDGSTPPDLGLAENIASGQIGYITPEDAVYSIWSDPVHMKAMVGYASGAIGVGVAYDDTLEYYTLEVRPAGRTQPTQPGQAEGDPTPFVTIPVVPLVACTPQPDGSIVHLVGYGQTLWAIAQAYHITIDQIRAWNNIAADSNAIYAGQKLLVLPLTLVALSPGPESSIAVPTSTETGSGVSAESTSVAASPALGEASLKTEPSPTHPAAASPTMTSAEAAQANPGKPLSLISPLWAGALILLGGALLVVLFVRRKG